MSRHMVLLLFIEVGKKYLVLLTKHLDRIDILNFLFQLGSYG